MQAVLVRGAVVAILAALLASGAGIALHDPVTTSNGRPATSSGPPAAGGAFRTIPSGPNLPAAIVPHVVFPNPGLAHEPPAWGGAHAAPGAPIPRVPPGESPAQFYNQWSDHGAYPLIDGTCLGRWPAGGQSTYSNNCYGHDEPAINPFSNLPGSGGNVSWNVRLPVDASPTHNQSDVYIAIWFGMNLYDPYGYNGQCFLEVQLYPDTNGNYAPQNGVWSVFVVAWQVELSTGFEDPCFAAPMYVDHTHRVMQMNQGDRLLMNMTGWVGSPFGEKLELSDLSTGTHAYLTLYNHAQHYPLDPAYAESNVEDSLPWSPGGDLPVAFSFESGHTVNGPGNNTFGGCSSGTPPPSPLYPSTGCGAYDPRAWAQDTKSPWEIAPPVFFNAHERQPAAQLGFEQDFGGIAWIDPLSQGKCLGADGSSYCSYPWYSWNGPEHAYNFGATDFTGTTVDYGQYLEYDSSFQTDSSGLPDFPVRNFSYPVFPGDALRVVVHGAGNVRFLDSAVSGAATFDHLPSGSYSLNAVPAAGENFLGYTTGGGVRVDAAKTAWSSFSLSGSGTLNAWFGSALPAKAAVTFQDRGGHGFVTVVPGFTFAITATYAGAPGFGSVIAFASHPTNVADGGALPLAPGIYSFQANPRPGYNFTGWQGSPSVYLFTPESNYTWANVTGGPGTVHALYAPTHQRATVFLASYATQGGSIRFGGTVYPTGTVLTVPEGSYALSAVPNPGYTFVTWVGFFMATMTDYRATTHVLVQNGTNYVTAAFVSTPVLKEGGTRSHGTFALDGVAFHGPLARPQVGNTTYRLEAVPSPGWVFAGWSVSGRANLWVADPKAPLTELQVNASGTLTPRFARASEAPVTVTFRAYGGMVVFDALQRYQGTVANSHVAKTKYLLSEVPAAGNRFYGWSTTGGVRVTTTYVPNALGEWVAWYALVVRGGGTVTAHFADNDVPLTFVAWPFDPSVTLTIAGQGIHRTLHDGQTAWIDPGSYTITLHGGPASLRWFATSNLTVGSGHRASTTLGVRGSGALYAVGEPDADAPISLPAAAPMAARA